MEDWLDSPAHREMILNERYHSAGITCRKGTADIAYCCVLFCQ
ncbi:hypothetical protein [Anaerotruncus colihominis]